MARFSPVPEFIQSNVNILEKRTASVYSTFLDKRPSFVTYYHVNKVLSTTDKGLKNIEALNGVRSPIRYNKILQFPIYGIEDVVLQLDEDNYGLDTDYDGEGVVLPNTIHPTGDDYFTIDYLDKKYTFRVTRWQYDTIRSNSYYKIEFTIRGVDPDIQQDIENQVVKVYNCIFENIGTNNNCLLESSDIELLNTLNSLYDTLRHNYLDLFYIKKYNSLLFHKDEFNILFDQNLSHFCNKHNLFNNDGEIETIFLYEEPRDYFPRSYARSIYDKIEHREDDCLCNFDTYYDTEAALATDSVFYYWRDKRFRYMQYYTVNENMFDVEIDRYIDKMFIDALNNKNPNDLSDDLSIIVYNYMVSGVDNITPTCKKMKRKHYSYSLHNFVFIPLVMYCIRQLINQLSQTSSENYYTDQLVEYTAENN